jgi:2'-5' RNA ligase
VRPPVPDESERLARLFVAFDLPDRLVAGLTAWQAEALPDDEWRAMATENLHLTLVFLGSLPERLIGDIAELVENELPSSPPSIRLSLEAVGIPRRRPRALAFEAAEASGVAELAEALEEKFADAGLFERDPREFWPHLTVARRRKRPAGGSGRSRRSHARFPSVPLPPGMTERFVLDRLVVYRSETRPGGSRHHAEASFTIT